MLISKTNINKMMTSRTYAFLEATSYASEVIAAISSSILVFHLAIISGPIQCTLLLRCPPKKKCEM